MLNQIYKTNYIILITELIEYIKVIFINLLLYQFS